MPDLDDLALKALNRLRKKLLDLSRKNRLLNFKEIKQFRGKTIPSVLEMIPQNKEGHKTVVRYLNAEFDGPIGDKIFTLRNLRKRR